MYLDISYKLFLSKICRPIPQIGRIWHGSNFTLFKLKINSKLVFRVLFKPNFWLKRDK